MMMFIYKFYFLMHIVSQVLLVKTFFVCLILHLFQEDTILLPFRVAQCEFLTNWTLEFKKMDEFFQII